MEKIIMYASDTCNYCKTVKEKLTAENIDFEVRLTNEFEKEWNKVANTIGVATLPTILYKEIILHQVETFKIQII